MNASAAAGSSPCGGGGGTLQSAIRIPRLKTPAPSACVLVMRPTITGRRRSARHQLTAGPAHDLLDRGRAVVVDDDLDLHAAVRVARALRGARHLRAALAVAR